MKFGLQNRLRLPSAESPARNTKTPADKGLVVFYSVEEAVKSEKIIKKANYTCKLVAPPPPLRKGCDLALEINLVERVAIERLLTSNVSYAGIFPLAGSAELLQIVKVKHFAQHVMVKAGNMKLTYDKNTGIIVNTSGGGCPDIPYLHIQLVGRKLTDAPRPKDIGYTLCALMLDRALEESLSLWKGDLKCC